MDQDPKTGKFMPGNNASKGRGGRPSTDEAEKLRAGLRCVVSNGSVNKWAESTRKRFEKGDMVVTDFIFKRILGDVPIGIELSGPEAWLEALRRAGTTDESRDTCEDP